MLKNGMWPIEETKREIQDSLEEYELQSDRFSGKIDGFIQNISANNE